MSEPLLTSFKPIDLTPWEGHQLRHLKTGSDNMTETLHRYDIFAPDAEVPMPVGLSGASLEVIK